MKEVEKKSMTSSLLYVLVVLSAPVFTGCVGATTAQSTPPPPRAVATSPAAQTWQMKWDKLVADARAEGQVVIASSVGFEVRDAFNKNFAQKYGVSLEFLSAKPAELVPKIQAERRAGMYLVDMFLAGTGTVGPILGSEGALEPLDPALLLPEVIDGKNWWSGGLLYTDSRHFQVQFLAFPQEPLTVNTDLVKPGDIKSYYDLLSPRWKGQITFLDPTMAGTGNKFFLIGAELLKDVDYLRRLGDQVAVITRDDRQMAEWVAKRKYAMAIGIKPEIKTEFRKAGASLEMNPLVEGTYLTSAGGGLALMNKAPHLNATRLFINWLLSREGGMVAAQAYGAQSAREDVPSDFLEPYATRRTGVNYLNTMNEGVEAKQREYMNMAKEMWGSLLK